MSITQCLCQSQVSQQVGGQVQILQAPQEEGRGTGHHVDLFGRHQHSCPGRSNANLLASHVHLGVDEGHLPGVLQEEAQTQERDELVDVQNVHVPHEELINAFVVGPVCFLPPGHTGQLRVLQDRQDLLG